MIKKMTPREKLGYKVGDEFEVVSHHAFKKCQIVTLHEDDGTECPLFAGEGGSIKMRYGVDASYAALHENVRAISKKLKPAKQALADAIHQNGGWPNCCNCKFSTSNDRLIASFFTEKPVIQKMYQLTGWVRMLSLGLTKRPLQNWHQTILSRDEYFTAYPEQVKVVVNNETEHKVEVEMTSESEMTIKVSEWHKNGDLPPVGEVCEAYIDYPPQWIETEILAHKDGFAIGWCKSVMKGCHGDKAHEFRPLRSEREKAIDEMQRIIEESNKHGVREQLGVLYDAGMHKEVK